MMLIEPDHYGVLELKPGSPMEDVKGQYRRLAKRWHPDLHGNDMRSQEQFRRVNAAYAFLSDAPRKAAYDACLEAAQKMGAPPLAESPPSATGYHARTPTDARLARSAWLGAMSGAVLVLLVIGLSLDGSGPRRPVSVGNMSLALDRAPSGALGGGAGPGKEDGTAATHSASSPSATIDVPAVGASRMRPHRLAPGVPAPVGNAWTTPPVEEVPPVDALKKRLQARYQAALPRADRLPNPGYTFRASRPDTEDGSRHILRDQQAAGAVDMSATRARIRPAIARPPRQGSPKALQQESRPILAGLRRLEGARQPVRDGVKALPAPAFRFAPPAPARTASIVPTAHTPAVPVAPAPRVATIVAPEAPKPPDKPTPKPKAPASSGQEFIMWGK